MKQLVRFDTDTLMPIPRAPHTAARLPEESKWRDNDKMSSLARAVVFQRLLVTLYR